MSERVQCPHEHSRRCGLAHGHGEDHAWVSTDAEAALTRERDRLRATLVEALEWGDEGWSYASDYFREKWDCAGERARIAAVLAPVDDPENP